MKHKAAVFDLYDTLIDNPFRSEEARRELSETAALLGVPEQEFMRGWSETFPRRETGGFATMEDNLEHIVRSAGGRVDAARIKAAADSRLEFTRRNFIPLPGAVETLARLKATGRTIGLISNCGSLIPLIWRGTPLAPLVDAPVFSFSAGLRKPDPRIYRRRVRAARSIARGLSLRGRRGRRRADGRVPRGHGRRACPRAGRGPERWAA